MVSATSQSVFPTPAFTQLRVSKSRSSNPENRVEPLHLSPETAPRYYDEKLQHASGAFVTAQEAVQVVGLMYYDANWYSTDTAQFMSPDNPLGHVVQFGDFGLSMGQLLSVPMIFAGLVWIGLTRRRV